VHFSHQIHTEGPSDVAVSSTTVAAPRLTRPQHVSTLTLIFFGRN